MKITKKATFIIIFTGLACLAFVFTSNKIALDYKFKSAEKIWEQQFSNNPLPVSNNKELVIIIPGMNHSPYEQVYQQIGQYFREQGIMPLYLYINWKTIKLKTLPVVGMTKIKQMLANYPEYTVYLFGYSLGAVIALNYAEQADLKKIILCSASPVFQNEIYLQPSIIKAVIQFFIKNIDELFKYPVLDAHKMIFLYGEFDHFLINKKIIKQRNLHYNGSKTVIIENGHHNLKEKPYMGAIKSLIGALNND